jgi:F0F1-type ATP synthase delta subunit
MFSRALAQLLIRKRITVKALDAFLTRYKLTSLWAGILQELKHAERKAHVHDALIIETPFELSPSALSSITKKMKATGAVHDIRINKNLLGGFKAIYKGTLLDSSLRSILNRITSN